MRSFTTSPQGASRWWVRPVGARSVKRVDYLLEYRPNLPIAVVEAKDNNHKPGDGMQQAIEYSEHLDVPSVFTSNGDSFVWHDRTGIRHPVEVEISLDEFPSPEQLYALYKQWKGITDDEEPVLTTQFYDDGSVGAHKVIDKSFELYLSPYQAVTGNEDTEDVYKRCLQTVFA